MARLARLRYPPLLLCAGLALVLTVAFFRLPDTLVTQLEDRRIVTGSAGDWTYRLLAVAAVLQAAYAGSVLRTERLRRHVPDSPVPTSAFEPLFSTLARSAAVAVGLTFVYLLAAFFLTGGRASAWFFVVVAIAQWAWYFRQLGKVAEWLESQPKPGPEPPEWAQTDPLSPATHVPPIAQALADEPTEQDEGG